MRFQVIILALGVAVLSVSSRASSDGPYQGATIDCRAFPDGCHLYGQDFVENTLYFVDSTHPLWLHVNGRGEIRLFNGTTFQTDDVTCTGAGVRVVAEKTRGWVYFSDWRFSGNGFRTGGNSRCPRIETFGVGYEGLQIVAGICEGTGAGVPCIAVHNGRLVLDGVLCNNVGACYVEDGPGPTWGSPIVGTIIQGSATPSATPSPTPMPWPTPTPWGR